MRPWTFRVLKMCKYRHRLNLNQIVRGYCCNTGEVETYSETVCAESWPPGEAPALRAAVLAGVKVLPDFITEGEERALMAELDPILKRMRYEFDHWDNAIYGFRETERKTWQPHNEQVVQRAREAAGTVRWLPATHVLDLAAAGHIEPHVDAVRFCGEVIAGLCLLSSAVMRLAPSNEGLRHVSLHALLPRRGLYVLRGAARYECTHAVLGGAPAWHGEPLPRARRVAVISRAEPAPAPSPYVHTPP